MDMGNLGGTEVGCKVGLWMASGGLLPLSLLFYPLTFLCAFCLSASLVLASNSQPDACTLPPPEAWSQPAA